MVEYKDYYKILGVDKSANAEAIKRAYRRLARKYHPDVNKGKGSAERFKEINEANEVLGDPEKRKRYDTLGADWQHYAREGFHPGAHDFGGYQVHFGRGGTQSDFDLGGFSDFFKTFFGDLGVRSGTSASSSWGGGFSDLFGGRKTGARQGEDLESAIEVSLEEAHAGTKRIIEFQGDQGHRRLEVKIPPGIRDGSRVRVTGGGSSGPGDGPKGDLYLKVKIRPHPLFERKEDDLHVEVPISVVEAALGAEIEIPTLRGKVSMRIPPETSSGKTFRLAGYGMPHVRGGGSGDQLVKVRVVFPSGLTEAERKHFEELRQLSGKNPRADLGLR